MKKIIFLGLVCAVVVTTSFISCEKKRISIQNTEGEVYESLNAKSSLFDDDALKNAIDGKLNDYENIFELERLLYSQSPLSNEVLIYLSEASKERIPDYLVELSCLIANPSSNNILNIIGENRENIDVNFIRKNMRRGNETKTVKINTDYRKIIFASSYEVNEIQSSDCTGCSKEIVANKNSRLVDLSIEADVIELIGGPASDCSNFTYCGFPAGVTVKDEKRNNMHITTFLVECDNWFPMECFSLAGQ